MAEGIRTEGPLRAASVALASELPIEGESVNLPDPEGTIDAIARIGYTLEESLADLIDNALDAEARSVVVRFVRRGDDLQSLIIVDDGEGMTASDLDTAMQFGRRTGKGSSKLGKYGMGLKSASFSQCQAMTVITRSGRQVTGRRWSAGRIRKDGWVCEHIEQEAARRHAARDFHSIPAAQVGTLVEWDALNVFRVAHGRADEMLGKLFGVIESHLGLYFHRFLGRRQIRIFLETEDAQTRLVGPPRPVLACDPFGYQTSGRRDYPKTFKCTLRDLGSLSLRAHVWPRKSSLPGYKLGGKVSQRQGFYFYRNDRLIQAGGWNGLRNDVEPHLSLARTSIDLPADYDSGFSLNVQKTKVDVPHTFVEAVPAGRSGRTTFMDYWKHAEEAYGRAKAREAVADMAVPGRGVPHWLSAKLRVAVTKAGSNPVRVKLKWAQLADDMFFDLPEEGGLVLLNDRFRRSIAGGGRRCAGDAPLVKTLLCLLLQDEMWRERTSKASRERVALWQTVLAEAAEADRDGRR